MNAILTCVDFSDILAVTLPRNRRHFDRFMVVTSHADNYTLAVSVANEAEVIRTEAFYENGAYFNKFLALERGLEYLIEDSNDEWLAILDCDVVWPRNIDDWLKTIQPGNLYTPRRRMLEELSLVHHHGLPFESTWSRLPLHPGTEFAGYSQIFHLSDPALERKPWFGSWMTAGTADSFFQNRWTADKKIRPPWEVLHLGVAGRNWAGRTQPMIDGTPVTGSGERNVQLRELLKRREEDPSDRFKHERLE